MVHSGGVAEYEVEAKLGIQVLGPSLWNMAAKALSDAWVLVWRELDGESELNATMRNFAWLILAIDALPLRAFALHHSTSSAQRRARLSQTDTLKKRSKRPDLISHQPNWETRSPL